VTGEANVVSQFLLPIGHPKCGMFSEYDGLFVRIELGKGPGTTEGIPNMPGVIRVEYVLFASSKQSMFEIGLVTRTVSPAKHIESVARC
jgi:hypothetical protein